MYESGFDSKITFEIPTNVDFDKLIRANNYTLFWQSLQSNSIRPSMISDDSDVLLKNVINSNASDYSVMNSLTSFAGSSDFAAADNTYDRFVADIWVGIVLTLMILSSVFCICSCFLYHKFRHWQRNVLTLRTSASSSLDIENPPPYDIESLPSYTIVSGLPSYSDVLEQWKQKSSPNSDLVKIHRPSVIKLFEAQSQILLSSGSKIEEIKYNFINQKSTDSEDSQTPEVQQTTRPILLIDNQPSTVICNQKKFNVTTYALENER